MIADWAATKKNGWLAGVVSVAIDERLDADRPYLRQYVRWACVYVPVLRELDPDDRQRISSAMARRAAMPKASLAETADAPIRQLWPNLDD